MDPQFVLQIALALFGGVVIAATTGLRAFLPLFALGLSGRFGWWPVEAHLKWMQSDLALIALGAATVIEIAGDKIPVVDHALDAVGTLVRPIAGIVGSFVVLQAIPAPWGQMIALAFGGVTLGVHSLKAKTRIGSSVATLGTGNPILSVVEDSLAVLGTVLALLMPFLGFVVVFVAVALLARAVSRPGAMAQPPQGRAAV